jgi:glycosyltransferase involved in cell wall biosynthesis
MPRVSIIVPCLNETATIGALLEAIYAQSFPRGELEVIIADGLSEDGTRQRIAQFQEEHPDLALQVVDNPSRVIPAGLNLAIRAAGGEIILRLDAHSVPDPEYVQKSLAALEAGRGWNVGGVWQIRAQHSDWIAEAIAAAAGHPFGVGDAFYRFTDRAQAVDTVPFGAFHKSLIDRIGPFDETLLANEDYEFNARVRQAGGVVWLDPAIRSVYFARSSLYELARQYARYGYWKWRMLRRYPETLRWRQALPPLFVLSFLLLPLLHLLWSPLIWLWLAQVVSYALLLLAAGFVEAVRARKPLLVIGLPLAIITMHFFWGGAFLWSMLSTAREAG